MAYEDLHQTAALKVMLPWLIRHLADTEKVMGRDFWAYGYAPNVDAIETLLRYHYQAGTVAASVETARNLRAGNARIVQDLRL